MSLDFVIVGVGRSGSSLLQSMLASHPEIVMPAETGFMRRAEFSLKPFRVVTAREAVQRYTRLNRVLNTSMLESDEVFRKAYDLYLTMLSSQKAERGRKWIGDKDPKLIEFLMPLSYQFPSVKVIHICRDPRDVIVSRREAGWSAGRPLLIDLMVLLSQLRIGTIDGEKLGKNRYRTIQYEELIQNPQQVLDSVCEFLGISFNSSMLSFQREAEQLISKEEYDWKKETTGPLNPKNSGRWKKILEPVEAALIEAVCAPFCQMESAETKRKIGVLGRLSIQLKASLVRILSSIYVAARRFHTWLLFLWKY